MKTTLTVKQIMDLGGQALLDKVAEFNGFTERQVFTLDKVFTFDSEFKKEKFDISKNKVFYFSYGRYDDTQRILIIADSLEDAMNKVCHIGDTGPISKDDFLEIDFDKELLENDGVIYL